MLQTAIVLATFAVTQQATAERYSEETRTRATRLTRLLEGPGPVRVIAFGDSITSGWGLADPDRNTYHHLFARALQARYHACRIDVVTAGGPGDESAIGLERLEHDVVAKEPDLVIIQFTGNDSRLFRPPSVLQQNMEALARRVLARTEALPILVANPMNDRTPGNAYVAAVQEAGRRAGVPVADFDAALFATDRDYRGPFVFDGHPMDFSHAACARTLLDRFDEATGNERLFDVRIEPVCDLFPTGTETEFKATVRSRVERPLEVVLDFGAFDLPIRHSLSLDPGETRTVQMPVPVPPLATPQRASTTQLLAMARCGRFSAFDTKWLTFAPVLHPDRVDGSPDDAQLHWHSLTHDCLVMGKPEWGGDWDLAGRVAVIEGGDSLTVLVDVTDDDITIAPMGQPVSLGDSVEVYLDFRAAEDQGKPVYGPDVVAILAVPGTPTGGLPRWQPLDGLTPMLVNVSLNCAARPGGYRVGLSIPLQEVIDRGGAGIGGFGLDVGINDADFASTRSTQMFYCGHAKNYLDPSRLAGVSSAQGGRQVWRVTLR